MSWKNSGESITLPIGEYTIEFSEVEGYIKPDDKIVTLNVGDNITRTTVYNVAVGSLSFTFTPSEITPQWRVVGEGTWNNHDTIIELPVGQYTIEFNNITSYITPENQIVNIISSQHTIIENITYELDMPPSILTVFHNIDDETVKWELEEEQQEFQSGESVQLASNQTYNIKFPEVEGYAKPNDLSVELPPNSVISRFGYYQWEGILGVDFCNEEYNLLKVNTSEEDGDWQLIPSSNNPSEFYPDNMYGGVIRGVICPEPIGEGWRIKKVTDQCFIRGLVHPTNIDGQWRIQGIDIWYTHNQTIQVPEGEYIVEFKPLMNNITPDSQRIIVNTHETIQVLGIYREDPHGGMIHYVNPDGNIGAQWRIKNLGDTGSIRVSLFPSIVGQWRLENISTWYNHNHVLHLEEGEYTIEFKDASGFIKPNNQKIILNTHDNINILGIYVQEG